MSKRGRPEKDYAPVYFARAVTRAAETEEQIAKIKRGAYVGRLVKTLETANGEKEVDAAGNPTGRFHHWRIIAVYPHHFLAKYISPNTKAHGIRHSFSWADVMIGKVVLC